MKGYNLRKIQNLAACLLMGTALTACLEEGQLPPTEQLDTSATVTITAQPVFAPGQPVDSVRVPFAAFQEADGPWRPMDVVNGLYSATVTTGRYGVAMGFRSLHSPDSEDTFVSVQYSTTTETRALQFWVSYPRARPYRLTLDVRGIPAGQQARASVEQQQLFLSNGVTTLVTPHPTVEVIATLQQRLTMPTRDIPVKMFRQSNVSLSTSPTVVIDFGLPLLAPLSYPATLDGSTSALVRSAVRTPDELIHSFATDLGRYYVLPSSLARATDLTRVTSSIGDQSAIYYPTTTGGTLAMQIGAPYLFPTPTMLLHPYARPSLSFTPTPGAMTFTLFSHSFSSYWAEGNKYHYQSYNITFSQGWTTGMATVQYTFPNFNGLPGWEPEMALMPRQQIDWSGDRSTYNTATITTGRVMQSASNSASIGEFCGNGIVEPRYESCDPPDGLTCSELCYPM
jgi:hypothetical protein